MMIADWERLSRNQKISALARHDGPKMECPVCGHMIHVARGYWTQHTDPFSWPRGQKLRQCANELRPYESRP